MGRIGLPELIVIFAIALLVFGPKKLPDLARGLREAIRDFKAAMKEGEKTTPLNLPISGILVGTRS